MLNLRLPTLADIVRLFFNPTRVDHVVAGVSAQVKGLEAVRATQAKRYEVHAKRAATYRAIARDHDRKSVRASDEHERATRVAGRLKDLVA